ncbi:hypothetical protein ABEF95_000886 [Exophiala dermatitidis]
MAGFSTPSTRGQQPAKQMSLRLLNMKFMQRAAAASPSGAATTQTPSTEPSSKRRRIEDTTVSPSASAPGTPASASGTPHSSADVQTTSLGVARGGLSTFNRGDGADTEWVLDLNMTFPATAKVDVSHPSANGQMNGGNPSRNSTRQGQASEGSEDEDIWSNQPSGRQTYGSFKHKRRSKTAQGDLEDNGDLSPGSEASDTDSDSDDTDHNGSRHRTPSRRGKTKASKAADSDEEMRQVRRAMEQKHRNMQGTGGPPARGGGGGGGTPSGGGKRRREDGNYKSRKKSRKTI